MRNLLLVISAVALASGVGGCASNNMQHPAPIPPTVQLQQNGPPEGIPENQTWNVAKSYSNLLGHDTAQVNKSIGYDTNESDKSLYENRKLYTFDSSLKVDYQDGLCNQVTVEVDTEDYDKLLDYLSLDLGDPINHEGGSANWEKQGYSYSLETTDEGMQEYKITKTGTTNIATET